MLGIAMGLVAGYGSRWIDNLLMATAEVQTSFPVVLLAAVTVGVFGGGIPALIIALVVSNWVLYARSIRGEVLAIRQREFVEAARSVGATDARIVLSHILPMVLPSIVVIATTQLAFTIVLESGLGFLGLGVPPSIPSWGAMLAEGRNYFRTAWWIPAFPGLAITATALGINTLGDGLLAVTGLEGRE